MRNGLEVVVVTGASAGLGRAIVRELGARGCKVGLIARGQEGLEAAAREVEAAGGEALVLPCDVADPVAVDAAADAVTARWGRIDAWINNAMVSVLSPIAQMTPEEFRRVIEVNYLGTVHGTLSALRKMRPRNQGTLVQIGSALAYRSIPLQSAYCASKAASRAFTDSLRSELRHDRSGIELTTVHLPAINTTQFGWMRSRLPRHPRPVAPVYEPETIARAVMGVLEHPRREHWIGGSTIKAIIGQQLIPGLLDRYLASRAWDGQQSALPRPANGDNLPAPLPGDAGAHGPFHRGARRRSFAAALSLHRRGVTAAALLGGLGLAALAGARR